MIVGTIAYAGGIIVSFRICLGRDLELDHVCRSDIVFASSLLLLRANEAEPHIVFHSFGLRGCCHLPSFITAKVEGAVETRVATQLLEIAIMWNLFVRLLLDHCGSCGMSDASVSHFDISDTDLVTSLFLISTIVCKAIGTSKAPDPA